MRRTVVLVLLIAIPAFGWLPTAHACFTSAPTVDTGVVYIIERSQQSGDVVAVNQVGVEVAFCRWPTIHTETWMESNTIPGLQTSDFNGCTPDTLVATTDVIAGRATCML
jgi:hypothetical protein